MKKVAGTLLFAGACAFVASEASADVILDLTTAGSSGYVNGAFYTTASEQSTGTGVIDSFLRIQANGTEQGYNTDAAVQFDEKQAFTNSLLLSAIPLVTLSDGFTYREFLLDINQNTGQENEFLSMNEVQIWLRNGPALNGFSAGGCDLTANCVSSGFNSGTKVYGMDFAGSNNRVEMKYNLNPGSGAGDIFLYVRDSLFDGAAGEKYVYLYSAFGVPKATNDGIEEWAVKSPDTPVPCTFNCDPGDTIPEPTTLALLGIGLLGAGYMRRRG